MTYDVMKTWVHYFAPPLFRVLEAIQIKTKGPNLNRDKGLDLDPVWDTLL